MKASRYSDATSRPMPAPMDRMSQGASREAGTARAPLLRPPGLAFLRGFDHQPSGRDNHLGPAVEAQFAQDDRHMRLHGRLRHGHLESDLLVELARGDAGQDPQ